MNEDNKGAAYYSHRVAQKQAKDLYDRATRLFRREPGWRLYRAALLTAMDAHQHASALGGASNDQERTYAVHMLRSAKATVEEAEAVKGEKG